MEYWTDKDWCPGYRNGRKHEICAKKDNCILHSRYLNVDMVYNFSHKVQFSNAAEFRTCQLNKVVITTEAH